MARCRHGFEPAAVKCPMGCHGLGVAVAASETTQAQSVARTRTITNQQIVDALKERGSLNGATVALGVSHGTIANRAKACVAVRDALAAVVQQPRLHTGGHANQYTDDQLRAALAGAPSIREVCKRLGVKHTSVYLRAKASPELRELYQHAKAVSGNQGKGHPGLRDLTGHKFGVLEVLSRAANRGNGNAAWVCACSNCGAEEIYEGITLRARRAAPFAWCRQCRPAAPGTVTRVAKEAADG